MEGLSDFYKGCWRRDTRSLVVRDEEVGQSLLLLATTDNSEGYFGLSLFG